MEARMQIAHLPERSVLFVGGPQARSFLDNILTVDVGAPGSGAARYGALLTPQGKILHDLFVVPAEDGYLLDAATAGLDDLIRRLTLYRLRSKVEIAPRPELAVHAAWGDGPTAGAAAFIDPRLADLGFRMLESGIEPDAGAGDYHARRIALGIADWDADIGTGNLFPHEANLDQLGGIDFAKGCYVGQEVVSRMQHRGSGGRNRILPVRFEGEAARQGSDVVVGERRIGTVLSGSGSDALALLRLDKLEQAYGAGEALSAEARGLSVLQPSWARFAIPARGAAA